MIGNLVALVTGLVRVVKGVGLAVVKDLAIVDLAMASEKRKERYLIPLHNLKSVGWWGHL